MTTVSSKMILTFKKGKLKLERVETQKDNANGTHVDKWGDTYDVASDEAKTKMAKQSVLMQVNEFLNGKDIDHED